MRTGVVRIVLGVTIFFGGVTNAFAQEMDFSTAIDTHIDTLSQVDTVVSHHITITNLQGIHYLQSAGFFLESFAPEQIRIESPSQIKSTVDGRRVTVEFITPVIGKGKYQEVTIRYAAGDLMYRQGDYTLGVIPAIGAENVASRSATITLPAEVGSIDYSSPTITNLYTEAGFSRLTFTPTATETIIFRKGAARTIRLSLSFSLKNANMTPIETQVALPPDTDYQRVLSTSIQPEPINLKVDSDQNVIATFKLEPNETKQITSTHEILLTDTPYTNQPVHRDHTATKHRWSLPAATVKKLPSLSVPITTPELLHLLPQPCVIDGDAAALETCIDTAIAVLRAKSIPARRLTSVSLVPLTTIPNRAPFTQIEYYDKTLNHWIPLDLATEFRLQAPQSTAQLLNNVTLVINGTNDASPLSAIAYPSEQRVAVDIVPIPPVQPVYQFSARVSNAFSLFKPGNQVITLVNNSTAGVYNTKADLIANDTILESFYIERLPVGGRQTISLGGKLTDVRTIKLSVLSQTYDLTNTKTTNAAAITVAIALVSTASGFAVFAGRLLVSRKR